MKNKQKAGVLKYLADFFRTFGGVAFFVSVTNIGFNRPIANEEPEATAILLVTGVISIIVGLYFVYVAEHYNDLE